MPGRQGGLPRGGHFAVILSDGICRAVIPTTFPLGRPQAKLGREQDQDVQGPDSSQALAAGMTGRADLGSR